MVPLPNAKSIERQRVNIMVQPCYISPNGEKIPYVPVNIQTNRDAYEATLHVLFKHVADFHLCMINVFSQKYGIPEDDIINTIRESQEFKNIQVNSALTMHDSLGYLSQPASQPIEQPQTQIASEETIPVIPVVVKKRIVKKKSTDIPVVTEAVPVVTEAAPVVAEEVPVVAIVRKTIRKTIPKIPKSLEVPTETSRLQEDNQIPITEAPIGKKIIRKKTLSNEVPAPAPAPEPITQFKDVIASTTDTLPMQKKVIRKKK